MKIKIIYCVLLAAILAASMSSCKSCGGPEEEKSVNKKQPLNVSIFLDLSHRIVEESDGMKGVEKDTEIVAVITDYLSSKAFNDKIKFNKDHIKVFFHPTPVNPQINQLAKGLEVDFAQYGKKQIQQKQADAKNLTKNFNDNLKSIYDAAVADGKYIGSDIWGFFDTQVNKVCVREGYRNVLIVITDGYIYHEDNLVEDKAKKQSSFITKRSLAEGYSLLPVGGQINGLEVLVLELKADPRTDFGKMKSTIEQWLDTIGVSRHEVLKTALPSTTKKPIEDFLNGN